MGQKKTNMSWTRSSLLLLTIATIALATQAGDRGVELLGYLENWVDVKWRDNNMPGNCYQGCFEPDAFIKTTKPYSALNYGFTFLTQDPNPDQLDCSGSHSGAKDPGCPVWDGEALYLSKSSKPFSHSVDSTTTIDKPTPSIIAISEVARMSRQHPDGPKRLKITVGGWSDSARMDTAELAEKAAVLASKLVEYSFADEIDIDMEHLTPFANTTGDYEFGAFAAFVTKLHSEFRTVETNWLANAKARHDALLAEYMAMAPWQRTNAKNFYGTNLAYFKEMMSNPVPHLEISWCTRFNAFVPPNDPFNYNLPGLPIPNTTYPTDNEGMKLWPEVGDLIDTVNIMAYDAGGLHFNFSTILQNFHELGNVSKTKINMGFEPGAQFAGGVWEGMDVDMKATQWIKDNGYGGVMVWAVNPGEKQNPAGAKECPLVASAVQKVIEPTYAWGPAPKYSTCDPSTGWTKDMPPTPAPPTPPGNCAAAWQQCGATGHPSCCTGTCVCDGSAAYKQCKPATGKYKC